MMAFAYQGNAVIIMTNADNGGKLISEVKNAISNYYNWQISQPITIEVVSLSNAELKQFTGKYKFESQRLKIKVQLKDKRIFIKNKYVGDLNLMPLTSNKFIDTESGIVIEFFGDEKVRGFMTNNGFNFLKI